MDSNDQVAADLLKEHGFHEQAEKLRKPPLLKRGTEFLVEGEERTLTFHSYKITDVNGWISPTIDEVGIEARIIPPEFELV